MTTQRSAAIAGFAVLLLIGLASQPVSAESSALVRLPHELAPGYHGPADGPVATAKAPDGSFWAVWSYRHAGELDIAVSRAVGRTWKSPTLLGEPDGRMDLDPQIGFLGDGTPVVAWRGVDAEGRSRILVSKLTDAGWSAPHPVSAESVDAGSPRLFSAGGSLSVGYLTEGARGAERGFTLIPIDDDHHANGGTNGPDPIPTIRIEPGEEGSGNSNAGGRVSRGGDRGGS